MSLFSFVTSDGMDKSTTWEKIVLRCIVDSCSVGQTITRREIIEKHLSRIVEQIGCRESAKTPDQTLSRILQDLRDAGYLHFCGRGVYRLLKIPSPDYWDSLYRYRGELMIATILKELGEKHHKMGYHLTFKTQLVCKLRTNVVVRPDFCIKLRFPDGKLRKYIIEFDGQQHWDLEYARSLFRMSQSAEEKFAALQKRDKIKDREFPRLGIRMLRVWKLNFQEALRLIEDFLFGDSLVYMQNLFEEN